ncbi:MAG TPA: response regulator transcription factor [Candidatus Sulfotelmatobacter sp.]
MSAGSRILIVDDFEPFRKLVGSILSSRAQWEVVAEAADGLDAIEKARALQPELILLDIGLPKMSGIQVAEQIRKTIPKSKIIFLSQETSPDLVQEALRLRVSGYVNKAKTVHELTAAIDAVLDGKRFFTRGLLPEGDLKDLRTEE